jgi:hypothetical protein
MIRNKRKEIRKKKHHEKKEVQKEIERELLGGLHSVESGE